MLKLHFKICLVITPQAPTVLLRKNLERTRLKAMQNRTRNKQLNLKFTEQELNYIKEKKELSKINNYTDFLLKVVSHSHIFYVDTQPLIAVAQELNKIGVNINQMAKVANTSGSIYENEIRDLRAKVSELEAIVKKTFSEIKQAKEGNY